MLEKIGFALGRVLCLVGIHDSEPVAAEYGGSGSDGTIVYYDRCARTGCDWKTPISYNNK